MGLSKFEIKGLYYIDKLKMHMPCGMNLWQKIWWIFRPGVVVNVKWPKGDVVVGPNSRSWSGMGPMYEEVHSADPNDHYRPWLEKHVGKQGKHWQWGMANTDASENRLTIKIVQSKAKYATMIALRWS